MDETPKKIGRYEVESLAGRGAMGVVYRATDPLIHRMVAIKMVSLPVILSDEQRTEFNERFFREVQAAGNLHHPNIVTIFDVGEENGVPFMAQEFIEGESLSNILKRDGVMDSDGATDILRQMADALQYAHSQGVVHRDVKPDNILIESGGRAVLTDFGVARLSSSDLTRTGEVLGTPHFMSPEQVLGEPVDGRSDLFSLGVVYYLMLTGQKPYSGDSVTSVCYQIVHSRPALPEGMQLPPGTAWVLEKLMAKSKDERFASGADVLEALDQLQDGTVAIGAAAPVSAEDSASIPTQVLAGGIPSATATERTEPAPLSESEPTKRPASKGLSGRGLFLLGGLGLLGIAIAGFLAFFIVVRVSKAVDSRKKPSATTPVNQPVNAPVKPLLLPVIAGKQPAARTVKKIVPQNPGSSKSSTGSPKKAASPAGTSSRTTAGKTSPQTPASSGATSNPKSTAAKPSAVNAHIGLIVEGGLRKGLFQVFANGKTKISVPFEGMRVSAYGKRYGFRIVKHMALKPGHHNVKFVLSSPRPRSFLAQAQRSFDVKSGDEYVLKIEPRRFPARLKVTVIEQKHAQ